METKIKMRLLVQVIKTALIVVTLVFSFDVSATLTGETNPCPGSTHTYETNVHYYPTLASPSRFVWSVYGGRYTVNPNNSGIITVTWNEGITSGQIRLYYVIKDFGSSYETLNVNPKTANGGSVSSTTICTNETGSISVTGNTGSVVQWERSSNDIHYSSVGGSSTTYTINSNSLSKGTYYYRALIEGECKNVYSSKGVVTVRNPPLSVSISGNGAYCPGEEVTLVVSSPEVDVTYSLYKDGSPTGATTRRGNGMYDQYFIPFPDKYTAGTYHFVATAAGTSCTRNSSNSITLKEKKVPSNAFLHGGRLFCEGDQFNLTLSDSEPDATYELYRIIDYYDGDYTTNTSVPVRLGIDGTGDEIDLGNFSEEGLYYVTGSNKCGTNNGVASKAAEKIVIEPGVVSSISVCYGASGSVEVTGNEGPVTKWQSSTDGGRSWTDIWNTATSISFSNIRESTMYRVVIDGGECNDKVSDIGTVDVITPPPAGFIKGETHYCRGSEGANIVIPLVNQGVTYLLYKNGVFHESFTATIGAVQIGPKKAGTYYLRTSNGNCTLQSPSYTITEDNPSTYSITGGGNICTSGGAVAVGLGSSDPGITYQLISQQDDEIIATEIGTGGAISFGRFGNLGTYRVEAIDLNTPTECPVRMDGEVEIIKDDIATPIVSRSTEVSLYPGESVTLFSEHANDEWFEQEVFGQPVYIGSSFNVSPPKTATYYVEAVNDAGCRSNGRTAITVSVNTINTIRSITYDENQNIILDSKSFFDASGRLKQAQTWNPTENKIFANGILYDEYERPVGQTLSAPIENANFVYKRNFATVSGKEISSIDWSSNSPNVLDNTEPGTLGHYYSANNSEPTPETGLPYVVGNFYEDGSGERKTSTLPGDKHFLTSGNNAIQKTLPVLDGELRFYTDIRNLLLNENKTGQPAQLVKQVVIDANSNESITYLDNEGNIIASAIGGGDEWKSNVSWENNGNPVDIHIPKGASETFSGYSIEDLKTETRVGSTLNHGFYRLTKSTGRESYPLNYFNYSYNFYDNKGRLIALITPKGVQAILDNGGLAGSIRYDINTLPYTTRYNYDFQGHLVSITEPDAGTTLYQYRKDGQIRFSQNADQLDSKGSTYNRFSYTEYDQLGRPVESGEYKPVVSGSRPVIQFDDLDPDGEWLSQADPSELVNWIKTYYDVPTSLNLPAEFSGRFFLTQHFVQGAVSSTESEAVQSWYSYDDQGRVVWFLQKIKALDKYFLIQYGYDFLGNVTKVAFQPQTFNVSGVTNEAFFHQYTYDANQRLSVVKTSIDDQEWYEHARYAYYPHGPLKRITLSTDLQGIDYIYTPEGWLKAINHPIPEFDPGGDGVPGSSGVTSKDAFGMSLEYYTQDYQREGMSFNLLNTNDMEYPDQYNGNIKAMVYGAADQGEYVLKPYPDVVNVDRYENPEVKAKKEINLMPGFDTQGKEFHAIISDELTVELLDADNVKAYAYKYDHKYQLEKAKHGSAKTHTTADNAYDVTIDGYDENGNIDGIERYENDPTAIRDNFDFTYAYELSTSDPDYCQCNRLVSVSNYIEHIGYNEIGQVTSITYHPSTDHTNIEVEYDVTGRVTKVLEKSNKRVMMEITYDDRGFRLKKKVGDIEEYYIRDASGQVMAIYARDVITGDISQVELPIYGSGKLGMAFKNPDHYKYIYELTDHLGSVRALVTRLELMATATMEVDDKDPGIDEYEEQYFDRMDAVRRLDKGMAHSGSYVATTNASRQLGPITTMRVKAGDIVNLEAMGWWNNPGNANLAATTPGFVSNLLSGINGTALGVESANLVGGVSDAIDDGLLGAVFGSEEARAYLQYILLNEEYAHVDSYTIPIADQKAQWVKMSKEEIDVEEDGYLIAYLANESNIDAHFDDFNVQILGTRVIRKTDYYPFGAVAKQWNNPEQTQQEQYRHGYQGQYAEADTTTGWNAFELRMYDPLIGRWLQVDPEREFSSPYVMIGNYLHAVDPDGGKCKGCPQTEEYATYIASNLEYQYTEDLGAFQMLPTFEFSAGMTFNEAEAARGAALVRQGQSDFVWGVLDLSAHITGSIGTGVSAVGYGAAFIPGAQPVAGALIGVGSTLSGTSSGLSAIKNFAEGDNVRGTLNLANAAIPIPIGGTITKGIGKGLLTPQAGNILNGGLNVKSSVADYMINNYHK